MANRLRPTLIAALAGLCGLLLLAFLSIPQPAHPEGRAAPKTVRVATTTSIFADLIANVGGERVEVTSLVPAGADPHAWEPTPREIRAVSTADVFVYNGLGLELWAPRLIEAAGRPGLITVELSQGLVPLELDEGEGHRGHVGEEGNPHFWLDVTYAIHYVRRIQEALAAVDPAGAAYYQARADAYVAELEELDRWIFAQVEQIPPERRVLVTYHNAHAYMARRYGLEVAGFLVPSPDREPPAQVMAQLTRILRERQVPAVFVEPQIDPRLAAALAREAGARIGVLYTDSLTADVPTYVAMMRANAQALVELLR
ncbi:MAG TPA: metal ABC transporter substrate-binding protein [Limnochordales bacterium]